MYKGIYKKPNVGVNVVAVDSECKIMFWQLYAILYTLLFLKTRTNGCIDVLITIVLYTVINMQKIHIVLKEIKN